jgi:FtsZ-interacting cell division protein YlmF
MDSFWGRALVYLGLKEEPEDRVDWEVLESADSMELPATMGSSVRDRPRERTQGMQGMTGNVRTTEVVSSNVRPLRAPSDAQGERTAVVQVRVFEDVESIGSRYRQRQSVLFDVSSAAVEVARRVVDFVSGLTYVSRGRLIKVAPRVFLLVPDGVRITVEEQRRLSTLGYEVGDEVVRG